MSTDTSWLKLRLKPVETVMAGMTAILWMAFIGALIASERMVVLVTAAFDIQVVALTAALSAVGGATSRYWLLSFPIWGCVFVGSLLWALSLPEKRQVRLAALVFALAIALFTILIATYIPFAQAASSIARPIPTAPAPIR